MNATAVRTEKTVQLIVSEIFGPTIQGEGPSCGRRAMFLRLGGCNLHCSFCDTAYTWRYTDTHAHRVPVVYDPKHELRRMSINEILRPIKASGGAMLVVTGGEPLLQDANLGKVLEVVTKASKTRWVEVETAGTIIPKATVPYVSRWNVSPKLASSGNTLRERFHVNVLRWFVQTKKVAFKFVCADDHDLHEVISIVNLAKIPRHTVWIMPEGVTNAAVTEHLQAVAEQAIASGFNVTTRLHVQIWGNRRGV